MSNQPVHNLYKKFLDNPKEYEVANNLWGLIPVNIIEAVKQLSKIKKEYGNFKVNDELKGALKNKMRKLGVLTSNVASNIDSIDEGIVESGQQPNCLGGPSFIFNKITCTWEISRNCSEKCIPVYFIGDYDSIQPELVNIRIPSLGFRGLLISYPIPSGYEGSPIRLLPNPTEEWLEKTFDKIESNYRGLLKGTDPQVQEKILLKFDHIETIVKNAYFSTNNVSDFSSKIIGTIVNFEGNLGIPMIFPSDSELKPFFQKGFEFLLAEPNRSNFIRESNKSVDLIEGLGYNPQIGRRKWDYIPFFFECPTPNCHDSRIELLLSIEGTKSVLSGTCPKCKEKYSFSYDSLKPDLSDIIDRITPRVDSRQIIVNTAIPVLSHVGGPGETSYYAEVVPAFKVLKIPTPIFIRYTRVFYNTPWNEVSGKVLKGKGFPSILEESLFKSLANWVEANKQNNESQIFESHKLINKNIDETYERLLSHETELRLEVESIKKQLSNTKNRDVLIKTMKEKETLLQYVENYLSLAYGRYSTEKYGQEVSWSWIDFALSSGIREIVNVYKRLYGPFTPNSSTYFVNL